jgi:hypothetical protein
MGGPLLVRCQYMLYAMRVLVQLVIDVDHIPAGIPEDSVDSVSYQLFDNDSSTSQKHTASENAYFGKKPCSGRRKA